MQFFCRFWHGWKLVKMGNDIFNNNKCEEGGGRREGGGENVLRNLYVNINVK